MGNVKYKFHLSAVFKTVFVTNIFERYKLVIIVLFNFKFSE